MSEIGLVPTNEGAGRYALQGVGTLREEGDWLGATAKAGDASWHLVGSSLWSLRRNATATDAAGSVIGDYRQRGRALRWYGRELQFRRASLGPRSARARSSRAARAMSFWTAGGRSQRSTRRCGRSHRPVNIEVDDPGALEPGLLLFVAFLVGSQYARPEQRRRPKCGTTSYFHESSSWRWRA
jgi:hypothetical protein